MIAAAALATGLWAACSGTSRSRAPGGEPGTVPASGAAPTGAEATEGERLRAAALDRQTTDRLAAVDAWVAWCGGHEDEPGCPDAASMRLAIDETIASDLFASHLRARGAFAERLLDEVEARFGPSAMTVRHRAILAAELRRRDAASRMRAAFPVPDDLAALGQECVSRGAPRAGALAFDLAAESEDEPTRRRTLVVRAADAWYVVGARDEARLRLMGAIGDGADAPIHGDALEIAAGRGDFGWADEAIVPALDALPCAMEEVPERGRIEARITGWLVRADATERAEARWGALADRCRAPSLRGVGAEAMHRAGAPLSAVALAAAALSSDADDALAFRVLLVAATEAGLDGVVARAVERRVQRLLDVAATPWDAEAAIGELRRIPAWRSSHDATFYRMANLRWPLDPSIALELATRMVAGGDERGALGVLEQVLRNDATPVEDRARIAEFLGGRPSSADAVTLLANEAPRFDNAPQPLRVRFWAAWMTQAWRRDDADRFSLGVEPYVEAHANATDGWTALWTTWPLPGRLGLPVERLRSIVERSLAAGVDLPDVRLASARMALAVGDRVRAEALFVATLTREPHLAPDVVDELLLSGEVELGDRVATRWAVDARPAGRDDAWLPIRSCHDRMDALRGTPDADALRPVCRARARAWLARFAPTSAHDEALRAVGLVDAIPAERLGLDERLRRAWRRNDAPDTAFDRDATSIRDASAAELQRAARALREDGAWPWAAMLGERLLERLDAGTAEHGALALEVVAAWWEAGDAMRAARLVEERLEAPARAAREGPGSIEAPLIPRERARSTLWSAAAMAWDKLGESTRSEAAAVEAIRAGARGDVVALALRPLVCGDGPLRGDALARRVGDAGGGPERWRFVAAEARACGRPDVAEDAARSAVEADPDDPGSLAELARALGARGRDDGAHDAWRRAVEATARGARPEETDERLAEGMRALTATGRPDLARRLAADVPPTDPLGDAAWLVRALDAAEGIRPTRQSLPPGAGLTPDPAVVEGVFALGAERLALDLQSNGDPVALRDGAWQVAGAVLTAVAERRGLDAAIRLVDAWQADAPGSVWLSWYAGVSLLGANRPGEARVRFAALALDPDLAAEDALTIDLLDALAGVPPTAGPIGADMRGTLSAPPSLRAHVAEQRWQLSLIGAPVANAAVHADPLYAALARGEVAAAIDAVTSAVEARCAPYADRGPEHEGAAASARVGALAAAGWALEATAVCEAAAPSCAGLDALWMACIGAAGESGDSGALRRIVDAALAVAGDDAASRVRVAEAIVARGEPALALEALGDAVTAREPAVRLRVLRVLVGAAVWMEEADTSAATLRAWLAVSPTRASHQALAQALLHAGRPDWFALAGGRHEALGAELAWLLPGAGDERRTERASGAAGDDAVGPGLAALISAARSGAVPQDAVAAWLGRSGWHNAALTTLLDAARQDGDPRTVERIALAVPLRGNLGGHALLSLAEALAPRHCDRAMAAVDASGSAAIDPFLHALRLAEVAGTCEAWDRAEAWAREALRHEPGSPLPWVWIGAASAHRGDWSDAEAAWQRVIDGGVGLTWRERGRRAALPAFAAWSAKLGRDDVALRHLGTLARVPWMDGGRGTSTGLAPALRIAAEIDGALALRFIRETVPGLPEVAADAGLHGEVAEIWRRTGEVDRAIATWDAGLWRRPEDATLLNNAAWARAEAGVDVAESRRLATRAVVGHVAEGTMGVATLDTLAWVYWREGRAEEARRRLALLHDIAVRRGESAETLAAIALHLAIADGTDGERSGRSE